MSAVALVLYRDGAAAKVSDLAPVMAALRHHGPDGQHVATAGPCAMGYQHFAALPAAEDHTGPWTCRDTGCLVMFCGRIDNRGDLIASLGSKGNVRDEALAWQCFLANGEEGLGNLIGRFILVAWDPRNQSLLLARDALGDEPLYYALERNRLVAASEPWAVQVALPGRPEADPEKITDYLAHRWPSNGHTFFTGVRELLPGHHARVSQRGWFCRQHWQFTPDDHWAGAPEETVHEAFRERLREAVSARLRTDHKVGISLSGGLDSTSVAVSAPDPRALTSFSWRFDRFRDSDEGSSLEAVLASTGLRHVSVPGDDLYTHFDAAGRPDGLGLNGPHTNTVHRLKQTLYRTAAEQGCRVVLTGDAADELYLGRNYWLRDLVRHHQLHRHGNVVRSFMGDLVKVNGEAWLALRMLAGNQIGFRRYLTKRKPAWMSPRAWHRWPAYAPTPLVPATLSGEVSYDYAIGAYRATYATYELDANAASGVDRRSPYRDRRVVEFLLQLPAWFYSRPPRYKVLVRDAFASRLPDAVLRQGKRGSLAIMLQPGLVEARARVTRLLENEPGWRDFLEPAQVLGALEAFRGVGINRQVPDGILWNATCLGAWLQKLGEAG